MSQQNPYSAPQSNLYGGGVPMANVSLPREMLVVADGMKFILWGLIVALVNAILAMILLRGGGAQAAQAAEGTGMAMVINIISIGAQVLTLIGMFKCTQIPVETGAKGMAQLAFYGIIVIIAVSLLINFVPWTMSETTVKALLVVGVGAIILYLVSFFAFLSFLKKTSVYLGDALCIERSSKLMTLAIVGGVSYLIMMLAVLATVFGGNQPGAGVGILFLVLGITALVCAIWGLIVYVGTVARIRTVIEAGVR